MSEFNEDIITYTENFKSDDINIEDLVDISLFLTPRNTPVPQKDQNLDLSSLRSSDIVEAEILEEQLENKRKKRRKCITISCAFFVTIIPILVFIKYQYNLFW